MACWYGISDAMLYSQQLDTREGTKTMNGRNGTENRTLDAIGFALGMIVGAVTLLAYAFGFAL